MISKPLQDKAQFLINSGRCTPKQVEKLQAYINHGATEAGKLLGICPSNFKKVIDRKLELLKQWGINYNDGQTQGSANYICKGESTLLDDKGNVKLKWVKTERDKERALQAFIDGIKTTFDTYKGKSVLTERQTASIDDDLLCVLPWGDLHVGLRVWADECGNSFDIDIAKRDIQAATERLIESAPNAGTLILLDLGDSMHYDSNQYTTTGGTKQDADTRFSKMFETTIFIMIHAVTKSLEKFENVIVRNVVGNHSEHGEQALRYALWAYFHNNDRVIVEMSPSKFWYYSFGKVLLGSCHGDKVKLQDLPLLMAHDVPALWGQALHRYWYVGHIHHQTVKEHPGCVVESFNTVAPGDSWHHASGYRSRQNMRMIVFHKDYGEIERITKDISMIHDGFDK